jgi:hypothetical protein
VLPLQLFVDAAAYDPTPIRATNETGFAWTGGLAISWLDGQLGVYAPLVGSTELMNPLRERGNFLERLSVRLRLQAFDPRKLLDRAFGIY